MISRACQRVFISLDKMPSMASIHVALSFWWVLSSLFHWLKPFCPDRPHSCPCFEVNSYSFLHHPFEQRNHFQMNKDVPHYFQYRKFGLLSRMGSKVVSAFRWVLLCNWDREKLT